MSNRRVVDVVMSYVKKAGKKGRTYTDMLKHVCEKVYDRQYDREYDRGVIAHCFPVVQDSCKKSGSRYIYCG
jgi:hypothetical protein